MVRAANGNQAAHECAEERREQAGSQGRMREAERTQRREIPKRVLGSDQVFEVWNLSVGYEC